MRLRLALVGLAQRCAAGAARCSVAEACAASSGGTSRPKEDADGRIRVAVGIALPDGVLPPCAAQPSREWPDVGREPFRRTSASEVMLSLEKAVQLDAVFGGIAERRWWSCLAVVTHRATPRQLHSSPLPLSLQRLALGLLDLGGAEGLRVVVVTNELDLWYQSDVKLCFNWTAAALRTAKALKEKGYACLHLFAKGGIHVDPRAMAQCFPDAVKWVWSTYTPAAQSARGEASKVKPNQIAPEPPALLGANCSVKPSSLLT